VFDVARIFRNSRLRKNLLTGIREVAQDRVSRAMGCLALAKKLYADGDHESIRAAINRAYYSTHHSIRAMILRRRNYDPDDHAASIKIFGELLGEGKFAKVTRLKKEIATDVRTAMDNRHVADYSPYDESRQKLLWVSITDRDWGKAAAFNISLAEKLLVAAQKVV
jgi:uncharacterized protein (UPF0332 family)